MGDAGLGLAQSRFELFAVEWQEEKLRGLNYVVWPRGAGAGWRVGFPPRWPPGGWMQK